LVVDGPHGELDHSIEFGKHVLQPGTASDQQFANHVVIGIEDDAESEGEDRRSSCQLLEYAKMRQKVIPAAGHRTVHIRDCSGEFFVEDETNTAIE